MADNASTDPTPEVVRNADLKGFKVRYLRADQAGKSHALNAGIALAQGEAILFTDDDVSPAGDWLERMAAPLLCSECEAVLGRVELAHHLRRPWMEPLHTMWLAATDASVEEITDLIGANMGIHRSVFVRIPRFDPELGPGATGFGEETLLYLQMREAGFRLQPVAATVVHHPESSRLLRSQWLAQARKRGHTAAYLLHHWRHGKLNLPLARCWYAGAKLLLRRLMQPPPPPDSEGCPPWEMSYVAELEMCRRFLAERKRPRNYLKHGLQKRPPTDQARIKWPSACSDS